MNDNAQSTTPLYDNLRRRYYDGRATAEEVLSEFEHLEHRMRGKVDEYERAVNLAQKLQNRLTEIGKEKAAVSQRLELESASMMENIETGRFMRSYLSESKELQVAQVKALQEIVNCLYLYCSPTLSTR